MTTTVPRPPEGITPADFFERWLPAQLASAPRPQSQLGVRVVLDGDGGGAWLLTTAADGLHVTAGSEGEADITLQQSVADWRAIVIGEAGAPSLAPGQASPADLLLLDQSAQSVLARVKGTVRFEITGFGDRTWSIAITFGRQPPAVPPSATISVDAETYSGMLARTVQPQQAFFAGKIKLDGDASLAMQLAMAMMPRFQ
jgi:putative sterol carrier protein